MITDADRYSYETIRKAYSSNYYLNEVASFYQELAALYWHHKHGRQYAARYYALARLYMGVDD